MKRDVFEKAQYLIQRIDHYDTLIYNIEGVKRSDGQYLLKTWDLHITDQSDFDRIELKILSYLKTEKNKLVKEFEQLK